MDSTRHTTPLVLGTMTWGREADKATARAMFDRALEAGVTTFDTAPIYGNGQAERWLGEFVRESGRDDLRVFTKIGYDGDLRTSAQARHAVRECVERMGGVWPSVAFLHRQQEGVDAFRGLMTSFDVDWTPPKPGESKTLAGCDFRRVRPGLSNYPAWRAASHVGDIPLVLSPMYSLLKRQCEAEILPMAQAYKLEVYPYSPLAAGLLARAPFRRDGSISPGLVHPGTRLADDERYRSRYGLSFATMMVRESFDKLATSFELHPATLAIAWVAAHPAVTAPIIGARNVAQLEPCLAAAHVKLSQKQYDAVSELTPAPCATDRDEERKRVVVA